MTIKKYHFTNGEEIVSKLSQVLKADNITDGALILIGGVDSCCISAMPKTDAKKDVLIEYNQPCELMGNGSVENGSIHIHATLGLENCEAKMGHLHWAKAETWFVDVYVSVVNN